MTSVVAHIANKDYGRIALAFARFTYFGREVMKRSTITGADGTDMLNLHAMRSLKADMRGLFMDTSETEFELNWNSVSMPLLLLADTCDTPKVNDLDCLFSAS